MGSFPGACTGRVGDTPARVTGTGDWRTYRRRVHQLAGPVALVLAGLWLAYLVPHKLRHRQQLLESRADDRYSEALRVVTVTRRAPQVDDRRAGRVVRPAVGRPHTGTTGLLTPGRGLPALTAGSWTGGDTVDRPHATPERVTAEAARRAATLRAARVAASARRAAAARRRAVLAAILLVGTAVGWAVVGLVPAVLPVVGIAPSVLFASVLVAGRAAVVSGRRHDEQVARQIVDSENLAANPRSGATRVVAPSATRTGATPAPLVTGRAVHPSEASTEVFAAIVADRGESGPSARHAGTGQVPVVRAGAAPASSGSFGSFGSSDEVWEPVPVPRPTYAMKPAAPRREPTPLGEVEGSTAVRPATGVAPASATPAPAAPASTPSTPADDAEVRTPEAPVETSGSIDLNAVLAKRRAAGQ